LGHCGFFIFSKAKKQSMHNPWHYFLSGFRRIQRFIAWFPILWNDEDWDEAYLFAIMRFKISRMRKEIEKNKRHVGYQKTVRDMKVAEELLARVGFSNFYWEQAQQLENNEKQGKCTCPKNIFSTEPSANDQKTGEPTLYQLVDLSCDYCKKMRIFWFKQQETKKKEDLDFLFKHLRRNVNTWWD
jgi:hypothetical protein